MYKASAKHFLKKFAQGAFLSCFDSQLTQHA